MVRWFMLSMVSLMMASGIAYAGEYTQKGFIVTVKANNVGNHCFLQVAKTPTGAPIQGGIWDCGSLAGSNMLSLAKTAKVLMSPVSILMEGNGAEYRPVYAIEVGK
ncbi:hypothetical protein [Carnimonas bestiolae]|uniref:hypothetical protein n=1 Tax=Carnimonas bestiolae TaxID=3402172 RepID=UPI003EDBF96E